jgi:hypothetical protein
VWVVHAECRVCVLLPCGPLLAAAVCASAKAACVQLASNKGPATKWQLGEGQGDWWDGGLVGSPCGYQNGAGFRSSAGVRSQACGSMPRASASQRMYQAVGNAGAGGRLAVGQVCPSCSPAACMADSRAVDSTGRLLRVVGSSWCSGLLAFTPWCQLKAGAGSLQAARGWYAFLRRCLKACVRLRQAYRQPLQCLVSNSRAVSVTISGGLLLHAYVMRGKQCWRGSMGLCRRCREPPAGCSSGVHQDTWCHLGVSS